MLVLTAMSRCFLPLSMIATFSATFGVFAFTGRNSIRIVLSSQLLIALSFYQSWTIPLTNAEPISCR